MRTAAFLVAGAAVAVSTSTASAINIELDYSYDTANFFNSGSTNSNAARAALETAASQLSSYLDDTFSAIATPDPLVSSVGTGTAIWSWSMEFSHPGMNVANPVELSNQTIATDTYLIYAGAKSLSGNTAGRGGPGGWGWGLDIDPDGGTFTSSEIATINATTDAFENAVETRGQTSGFANWGGSITFDNDGSTIWSYDHTQPVVGGTVDFYSVALHELVHALGLGASEEWDDLISGGFFTGAASVSANGGSVAVNPGADHWAAGTMSTTFVGGTSQEAAMDPDILAGTRKFLTTLDAAGLTDIGWTVVPEPASLALLVGGVLAVAGRRRAA